jgi:uncharacterized protein (DUF1800 family)
LPTAREDVAHLLRRAGFGGLPPEIDALTPLARADIVERLLDASNAPAVVPPAELSVSPPNDYNRWVAVQQWWIERMRTTPAPLQEKMTLFWHGHFTSENSKLNAMLPMFRQNQIFRTMGLGSFRALTQTVSLDPVMVYYLDNTLNTKTVRNENFARELMELFTLGVNQYTQDDIVASAKAWTGHNTVWTDTVNYSDLAYVFNATKHDTTNKTFFGTTKNWNGPDIIDEILTGAKKPIAARFIANKLWSFLAYPNPEPAVSDAITNAFLASTDLNITSLLRAIFNRDEFYSPTAKGALVRTPTEFMVAALRSTGISAAAANPRSAMEQWLTAERINNGWGEQPNLITLTILSPDFQLA